MDFYFARNRKQMQLTKKSYLWEEFTRFLSRPKRTSETMAEFMAMSPEEQVEIKDCGGFVAGSLRAGRRRKDDVETRCCVTLDLDNGDQGLCERLELENKYTCCIYSTHKHTPEKPRLRLIYPLKCKVNPKEYEIVARGIAEEIGMHYFDATTFAAERLMFLPSTSKDGVYYFKCFEGKMVDPSTYLKYAEQQNLLEIANKEAAGQELNDEERKKLERTPLEKRLDVEKRKVEDPTQKSGIIGAFCRTYNVIQAIDKFLTGTYERTADPNRYNYIQGEGGPGVVVYDDAKFVYSFHATDKLHLKLLNAYDLVRLVKFGGDERSSRRSMDKFALEDAAVRARYEKEKEQEKQTKGIAQLKLLQVAASDNNIDPASLSWHSKLEYTQSGDVANTLSNQVTIMENDAKLKNVVYNEQTGGLWVNGEVPWPKLEEGFSEADFAGLQHYYSKYYSLECGEKLYRAVQTVAQQRPYNPIKEYFAALPAWDGTERIKTLLIDFLGAEPGAYTEAVMVKTMVAAVARVYEPGIQFDTVLVLNGPQGCGKSTLFKKLGRRWFSDNLTLWDMKDKTAAEKLSRYWILELAELEGINKASLEMVKSFVSRQTDAYRAAYDKEVTERKRRCILVGTTNQENYLRDTTGNRRFWPVNCSGVSVMKTWDMTDELVDQLWAEALVLYKKGYRLQLEGELVNAAVVQQKNAMVHDERSALLQEYLDMYVPQYEWEDMSIYERRKYIENWNSKPLPESEDGLVQRNSICYLEIITEFFKKDAKDDNSIEKKAIKEMMATMTGWSAQPTKRRKVKGLGQQRCFERIG